MLNAILLFLASTPFASAPEQPTFAAVAISESAPQEPARPNVQPPSGRASGGGTGYSGPGGGTPEPAMLLLLAGAAAGYAVHRNRRRTAGTLPKQDA